MKKLTLVVSGFALAVALSPVVSQTTRTAAAHATGKPQLGRFGVDESGMDKRVAPGDDFYRYVNGAWNDRTEIPADKSSWGGFGVLRDLSDQRTRAVIEDGHASEERAGQPERQDRHDLCRLHGSGCNRGTRGRAP